MFWPSAAVVALKLVVQLPTSRLATTPARHLLESGRHIDWAFARGSVEIDNGRVHNSIEASDHHPISFELGLSGEG